MEKPEKSKIQRPLTTPIGTLSRPLVAVVPAIPKRLPLDNVLEDRGPKSLLSRGSERTIRTYGRGKPSVPHRGLVK